MVWPTNGLSLGKRIVALSLTGSAAAWMDVIKPNAILMQQHNTLDMCPHTPPTFDLTQNLWRNLGEWRATPALPYELGHFCAAQLLQCHKVPSHACCEAKDANPNGRTMTTGGLVSGGNGHA